MELYKHQKDFLEKNPDKSALVWSCGTGKTKTAIEWSISKGSLLIICPKALKANWMRETQNHLCIILTKEEFRRDFKILPKYDQIIVDEVHMGFLTPGWKSQMSKALKKYIEVHKVPRVLLLTATPFTSSPWNIYNLAWITGHKWNWRTFRMKFFIDVRMGPRVIPVAKKGCEKELARLTKSIADVVDIKDVVDVPFQFHAEPEYFALNSAQRRSIELAYDPLPIVRFTAEHQIEQRGDKMDRIKSLCEENPKIAIVCRYKDQIKALESLLSPCGTVYTIHGDVKDRDAVCRSAEAAQQAIVIIQADCGVGFELPSFSLCVFASQSYSYTSYEQMLGRFLRMNALSRTTFMYLLTEGESVDQAVYDGVRRKEDFKAELFRK